ncbi:hypothetical protein BC830DRAFT_1079500 [Chytriomyces sp. MP71]|nr:hypothetical protein BC830DRAFT_1079500 [Chytriomyces sp. MP71]
MTDTDLTAGPSATQQSSSKRPAKLSKGRTMLETIKESQDRNLGKDEGASKRKAAVQAKAFLEFENQRKKSKKQKKREADPAAAAASSPANQVETDAEEVDDHKLVDVVTKPGETQQEILTKGNIFNSDQDGADEEEQVEEEALVSENESEGDEEENSPANADADADATLVAPAENDDDEDADAENKAENKMDAEEQSQVEAEQGGETIQDDEDDTAVEVADNEASVDDEVDGESDEENGESGDDAAVEKEEEVSAEGEELEGNEDNVEVDETNANYDDAEDSEEMVDIDVEQENEDEDVDVEADELEDEEEGPIPAHKKAKLARVGTMAATLNEAKSRGFAAENADTKRPAASKAAAALMSPPKKSTKTAAVVVPKKASFGTPAPNAAKLARAGTMAATVKEAESRGYSANTNEKRPAASKAAAALVSTPKKAIKIPKNAELTKPGVKVAKMARAGTMAATLKEAADRGFAAADNTTKRPASQKAAAALISSPKKTKKRFAQEMEAEDEMVPQAPTPKVAKLTTKLTRAGTMAATLKEASERGLAAADGSSQRLAYKKAAALISPLKKIKDIITQAPTPATLKKGRTMVATVKEAEERGYATKNKKRVPAATHQAKWSIGKKKMGAIVSCAAPAPPSPTVETMIKDYITKLPVEVLALILSRIHPSNVASLRSVCRNFNVCITSKHFAILNLEHFMCLDGYAVEVKEAANDWDKLLSSWPENFQDVYLHAKLKFNKEIRWTHTQFKAPILPDSLGMLAELELLDISFSLLEGEIPASFSKMSDLKELNLNYNRLTGNIPALSGVTVLRLNSNDLSGPIPDHLPVTLEKLNLMHNMFDSSIPSSIGNLINLTELWLNGNELSGEIPEAIGNLTLLRELFINHNRLRGCIPSSIGRLSRLVKLDVSQNEIEGPIPPILGNLSSLQQLDISHNKISGYIPPSLGQLPLIDFQANHNCLIGAIPAELGGIATLEHLILNDNSLAGTLDPALGRLVALRVLNVSNNKLHGYVPGALGDLPRLKEVHVSQNLGIVICPSVHHLSSKYARMVATLF